MIFMNMAYPGKSYRVQVYDDWLGEEFEPMDNPKDGDKIVYRIIGENGQPVEQKTEVYQNGAWVEQGGGGEPSGTKIFEGEVTAVEGGGGMIGGIFTPDLSGAGDETPTTMTVVLNDTEVTLPVDLEHGSSGSIYFGEFDGTFVFTTYPCGLMIGTNNVLIVPEAGTYSLTIYAPW